MYTNESCIPTHIIGREFRDSSPGRVVIKNRSIVKEEERKCASGKNQNGEKGDDDVLLL